jgi:hypothetical protein
LEDCRGWDGIGIIHGLNIETILKEGERVSTADNQTEKNAELSLDEQSQKVAELYNTGTNCDKAVLRRRNGHLSGCDQPNGSSVISVF